MIDAIFSLLTMDRSSLPSWLPDFIEKYAKYLKIGANVVRAHERFPCGGRRSGH